MIGRSGERVSGISVLPTRHDEDDDDGNCASTWTWFLRIVTSTKVFLLILNFIFMAFKMNFMTLPIIVYILRHSLINNSGILS